MAFFGPTTKTQLKRLYSATGVQLLVQNSADITRCNIHASPIIALNEYETIVINVYQTVLGGLGNALLGFIAGGSTSNLQSFEGLTYGSRDSAPSTANQTNYIWTFRRNTSSNNFIIASPLPPRGDMTSTNLVGFDLRMQSLFPGRRAIGANTNFSLGTLSGFTFPPFGSFCFGVVGSAANGSITFDMDVYGA